MSDYQDMCDMFGLSAADPEAIDKMLSMIHEDDDEDNYDPCEDCTCDDPTNCPKDDA